MATAELSINNRPSPMTLGLDLTGSRVRAIVLDDAGTILARAEHRVSNGLSGAVRQSLTEACASVPRIRAIGVATAFPGEVLAQDVASAAAEVIEGVLPLRIASGPATAIAETSFGVARGLQNVVTFSIGDHVTAGLVVNGRIWTGAHGLAGSVSWLALNPVEREDYRRFGALAAEVAAAGIVRRLVWRVKSGDRSAVVDKVDGNLGRLTADDVFQAAREGDGVCISVLRDTARYVGMAVSNLAAMLDPEAIVLGGTLPDLGDLMLESIRSECARRLCQRQAECMRILLSSLGPDAVAIGAARAAALQNA